MIRRERRVGAAFDQQPGDTGVIRPDAVNEHQNDLIDGKAKKEGETRCDEHVPVMLPGGSVPPLRGNGDYKQLYADGRYPDAQEIRGRGSSSQIVDRAGRRSVNSIQLHQRPSFLVRARDP